MKLLLFLLIPFSAQAYENLWAIKVAGSLGYSELKSFEDSRESAFAIGFNTHFGYRFKRFEINASSYVNISKFEGVKLQSNENIWIGKGDFRSVSFGPTMKYFYLLPKKNKTWGWYIGGGPLLGIQTFKYDDDDDITVESGTYNASNKTTFDSKGFILLWGREEYIAKSKRPVFFEISYKYLAGNRLAAVGGKPTLVRLEFSDKTSYKVREHAAVFSMGITLF